MKILFYLIFASTVWAQNPPRQAQPQRPIQGPAPVITRLPPANPAPVRPDQLRQDDLQRLRQGQEKLRSGGAGGDDVGNGGDELRLAFVTLAGQWLSAFPVLADQITIKKIIVIDDLRVGGVVRPYAVVEGFLLLDRGTWDPVHGYLSPTVDSRLYILSLLQEMGALDFGRAEILRAWNSLSGSSAQILCVFSPRSTRSSVAVVDQKLSGDDQSRVQETALRACRQNGLSDCRIIDSSLRGFGTLRAEVTVRGHRVSEVALGRSDLRQEQCNAVRTCEEAHEWAPAGQVNSADFARIENEANNFCR